MRLVQLRCNEITTRTTKFGERLLIVASGDLKSEIKIWRPLTDPAAQAVKANQYFTAAASSDGKYAPIAPPAQEEAYTPNNSYSPLAIVPKPSEPLETKPATPAIHPHVKKMAEIMSQCVRAVRSKIPGLDPESEQKYAVSLFIQASKEIF